MKRVVLLFLCLTFALAACSHRYSEDQLKAAEQVVLNGTLFTAGGAKEQLDKAIDAIVQLEAEQKWVVESDGIKHDVYGPGIRVGIKWKGASGLTFNADWFLTEKGALHALSTFAQGLGLVRVDSEAAMKLFKKR